MKVVTHTLIQANLFWATQLPLLGGDLSVMLQPQPLINALHIDRWEVPAPTCMRRARSRRLTKLIWISGEAKLQEVSTVRESSHLHKWKTPKQT